MGDQLYSGEVGGARQGGYCCSVGDQLYWGGGGVGGARQGRYCCSVGDETVGGEELGTQGEWEGLGLGRAGIVWETSCWR